MAVQLINGINVQFTVYININGTAIAISILLLPLIQNLVQTYPLSTLSNTHSLVVKT